MQYFDERPHSNMIYGLYIESITTIALDKLGGDGGLDVSVVHEEEK